MAESSSTRSHAVARRLMILLHAALCYAIDPTYMNITSGVPQTGFVSYGAADYYQFVVPLPLPRMTIAAVSSVGQVSLYASAGPFWDPEPGNYEWKSVGQYGPNIIALPYNMSVVAMGGYCRTDRGYSDCSIQVAVWGVRASNYTLVVTVGNSSEVLQPGVPSVAALRGGAPASFSMAAPAAGPGPVTFGVTPLDSSRLLAIYATNTAWSGSAAPPDPAKPNTYCTSAVEPSTGGLSAGVSLSIAPGSACACQAVPGCTYVLTVATAPGSGPAGGLAPTDELIFTILASVASSGPSELVDGLAVSGNGAAASPPAVFSYAAAVMPAGANGSSTGIPTSLTLVLTPGQGLVQLAVGFGGPSTGYIPSVGTAAYTSSGGPGVQIVTISATDPVYTAACPTLGQTCPLLIAVWTVSASSSWSLLAGSNEYTALSSGIPTQTVVPAGAVSYFRFSPTAGQTGSDIIIAASAVSGNAALFVGCDSMSNGTTRPDPNVPGSYIWSCNDAAGDEVVIISGSDPNGCQSSTGGAGQPCSYYVGVASTSTSIGAEFTLLLRVAANSSSPTPLTLGEIITDAVAAAAAQASTGNSAVSAAVSTFTALQAGSTPSNQYTVAFDPSVNTITLSLYNIQGAASLFANVYNAGAAGGVQPVNPSTAAYAVTGGPGGSGSNTASWEGVTISATDPAVVAACGVLSPTSTVTCVVALAVTANATAVGSAYAHYLLVACADVRQVVDSLPVVATVPPSPAIAYFRYTAPARVPFTVTVTPISGDPDLLMSALVRPNATSSQWNSLSPGGEIIVVQWTEPWINPARNPGMTFPVDFYIGVSGFDGSAEFSLTVTSNPFTTLLSGVPQVANSKGGILRYFTLQLPPTAPDGGELGFSITITPISGDPAPVMYVNTVNHTVSCAHCGWPYCRTSPCDPTNIGDYNRHWSSEESPDPLYIEVDTVDPNYEPGEQYIIAVLTAADAEFSITAQFSDSIAMVTNQQPVTGRVTADGYTWYALDIVNPSVVLSVVLTPLQGIPELYVSVNSTNRRPTSVAYDKRAVPGQGSLLAVVFQWSELPECPDSSVDHTVFCHAYIGVKGGSGLNATFTLLADAAKPNVTELLLVDGQPQNNVVVQGDYVYYYALVAVAPTTAYSVTLNPYGTAKIDLYATTDGTRPSATNYQYGSARANGPEQVTISPGDPFYCNNCTLRVAVHHPFIDIVGFDITYEANALSSLVPGLPTAGNTQVTQARYYSLAVYTPGDLIDFSLTGASGAPLLYVAQQPPGNTSFRPTPATSCLIWQAGGLQQTLRIKRGDLCYCPTDGNGNVLPCTYVIAAGCTGIPYHDSTCRYMLTGTTDSSVPVQLTDGVSLTDAVEAVANPNTANMAEQGRTRLQQHTVNGAAVAALAPTNYRYFSFDMSIMMLAGGNLTISVGSSNGRPVQIIASNAPRSLPTVDNPASVLWDSNQTGPVGGSASLTVSYTDSPIQACPTCTLLIIGVLSPPRASASGVTEDVDAEETAAAPILTYFSIRAATTTGSPQRLQLGAPSVPVTVGYKTSTRFMVYVPEGGQAYDLVFSLTILTGMLSFTVDPDDPGTSCFIGPPPQRAVRCEGMWTSFDGSPLRIRAADPCANAAPGMNCSAAAVWRPGPYYISVFVRYSPTTFIVTASQPNGIVTLQDSVPQEVSTTQGAPVQMQYQAAYDVLLPAVRFTITADSLPLTYYLLSCVAGSGGCSGPQALPGPTNPATVVTGSVDAQGSVTVTLIAGQPGYCHDNSGGEVDCIYALSLLPPPGCLPVTCSASATVLAAAVSGSTPLEVPWATINGRVYSLGGAISPAGAVTWTGPVAQRSAARALHSRSGEGEALGYSVASAVGRAGRALRHAVGAVASALRPGSARARRLQYLPSKQPVELYLSPLTGPTDLFVTVSACAAQGTSPVAAAWPSVYACDPSLPAAFGCSNPFAPGPGAGSSTAQAFTNAASDGGAVGGFLLKSTAAAMIYMAVTGGGQSVSVGGGAGGMAGVARAGHTQGWSAYGSPPSGTVWELAVSAGPQAVYLLTAPSNSPLYTGISPLQSQANVTVGLTSAGSDQTILWPVPLLQSVDGSIGVPAPGSTYVLYFAPSSFASTASAAGFTAVPRTACGLETWAQAVAGSKGQAKAVPAANAVTAAGYVQVQVSDYTLDPGTAYEVAVIATCNADCASAAFNSLPNPPVGALYTPQRAAYGRTAFVAVAGKGSAGEPGNAGPGVGLIAGAVGGSIAGLLVLAGGLVVWKRRNSQDAYHRVSGGNGLAAVVQEDWQAMQDEPAGRGGGGVLGSVWSSVSGSPGGGHGGAGGGQGSGSAGEYAPPMPPNSPERVAQRVALLQDSLQV